MMEDLHIAKPLTLKCGLTLPNRLVKAAMTEQMADKDQLPDARLNHAYSTWADGGWGMVLTGKLNIISDVNGAFSYRPVPQGTLKSTSSISASHTIPRSTRASLRASCWTLGRFGRLHAIAQARRP